MSRIIIKPAHITLQLGLFRAETKDNGLQGLKTVTDHHGNPQPPRRGAAGFRSIWFRRSYCRASSLSSISSTAFSRSCRHGNCSRSHTSCRIRGNRSLVISPCCLTLTMMNLPLETWFWSVYLRAYSGRLGGAGRSGYVSLPSMIVMDPS